MKEYLNRDTNQKKLKLTVQSCGSGKFRLGINANDSSTIFQVRYRKVTLKMDKSNSICTKTTCGPPKEDKAIRRKKYKKGYDLYGKQIDEWIRLNLFHCYEKGKPTKLEFLIIEVNFTIILKYTGITENNNCKCLN